MTSNNSGVDDFDKVYRDQNGKLLWDKLRDDIVASGQKSQNREEFEQKIAVIRKRREQQPDDQNADDNPA